jgi:hypothetical protein
VKCDWFFGGGIAFSFASVVVVDFGVRFRV